MKENETKNIEWRKLDNTAKIFPIVSTKKFSNTYRMSVVLKQQIIPDVLQESLILTLPNFKNFKVKLKQGFFWYYFETNNKIPKIEEEKNYPCKYIDGNKNNGFIFKVTYFKKRINLDVSHSITDGNGALNFLKAITYNYIKLIEKDKIQVKQNDYDDICYFANNEDSYIKYYNQNAIKNYNSAKAYQLKGNTLPFLAIGATQGHINLEQLLQKCREKNVTISEYLTALLTWSIFKENQNSYPTNKPIKVYIPVNLRNFFDSTTNSNFFSFITISSDFKNSHFENFDSLLLYVKNEFNNNLTKENLTKKISSNVLTEKSLAVRLLPLFIKKVGGKIGYLEAIKHHTTTLSNLGKIEVLKEFEDYIDNFSFLVAPSIAEKIKCCVCSYKNNLIFSFSSILEETYIERFFFRHLVSEGIDVTIESNGVYNENM